MANLNVAEIFLKSSCESLIKGHEILPTIKARYGKKNTQNSAIIRNIQLGKT